MHAKGENQRFVLRDLGQIAVGACVMAFPAATTEEVWVLGEELRLGRVLLFALASCIFLGIFIHVMHNDTKKGGRRDLFKRILATYCVTFLICAMLLYGLDRLVLLENPLVGLKRTILVTFPASFFATVIDGLQ